MIYEVEKNYLTSYLRSFLSPIPKKLPLSFNDDYLMTLTSSGKAALHLILQWLSSQKIFHDKTDSIVTPRWLGNWVYKTIQQTAFPTDIVSNRSKAILVYHQYGFPQNMDEIMTEAKRKNLVVIEDCAHALESYYHNQRLGTIGEFGIFSFSKFFPLLMGGAILTKNKNAHIFFQEQLKKSRDRYRPFLTSSKFLANKYQTKQTTELLEMSYALYPYQTTISHSAQKILTQHLPDLEKRRLNYQTVKSILGNTACLPEHKDEVLPYVVPLFSSLNKLDKLVSLIRRSGFFSNIYHFDANRNIFNPNFLPVVWLPIHQGIKNQNLIHLCQAIKNILISK